MAEENSKVKQKWPTIPGLLEKGREFHRQKCREIGNFRSETVEKGASKRL